MLSSPAKETPIHIEPALFDPASIDPETAAFNEELGRTLAALPQITEFVPAEVRAAREAGEGFQGEIILSDMAATRTIPGPGGDLGLRLFVPDTPEAVYLHLHGGGHTIGAAHHMDPHNEDLAVTTRVAVVSVDYRLAPEHPYPAGPDDCEAAAEWLVENATAEFGTDRLLIGGESAGAHLSAVTLLRLRDRHAYTGFLGANLVYGVYDLAMTPSQANWGERNLILSTPIIKWFSDHFVPEERRREPDVSPLYADLHDMPPALFTIGTMDPLLDDTLFMAARWEAAGNETQLEVYPGGVHAFDYFPELELGKRARRRMHQFIADRIGR